MKADIGLIGLAVMGENLVLNMESKGFTVAVFNRTVAKVDDFMNGRGEGQKHHRLPQHRRTVSPISRRPRKVMMLVKAGRPSICSSNRSCRYLEEGDIIIDGGNSHFPIPSAAPNMSKAKACSTSAPVFPAAKKARCSARRSCPAVRRRHGTAVKPIFQKISAQTDAGEPCCDWVGENGAGHFVKMVHNGIEYGDMQMICETYQMMKQGLGMSNEEMHEVFKEWNEGELDSYLIEITRDILGYKNEDGEAVIDLILDTAGQKGTGKWTAVSALDLGQPLTLIGEAVFARCLSALKDERVAASKVLNGPAVSFDGDKPLMIDDLKQALYASKIVSYAQGYQLMRAAAEEYGWNLNNGGIALMWRGGCIIRSVFLGKIKEAFDTNPELVNLLLDPFFKDAVENAQAAWRRVIMKSVELGIPMPAISAALAYYDGYRAERLPANLLQAQRDYFGAHTYERLDKPRGEFFHTNWTGRGGDTAASTYIV